MLLGHLSRKAVPRSTLIVLATATSASLRKDWDSGAIGSMRRVMCRSCSLLQVVPRSCSQAAYLSAPKPLLVQTYMMWQEGLGPHRIHSAQIATACSDCQLSHFPRMRWGWVIPRSSCLITSAFLSMISLTGALFSNCPPHVQHRARK